MKKLIIATVILGATAANATQMAKIKPLVVTGETRFEQPLFENKTEEKFISNYHVNRIVTPFKSPSIKLDSVQGVSFKQQGSVIYLSTTSDRRIAAFITEKGDESDALSVILIPKKLPPQEVILNGKNGSLVARKFERSLPRVSVIKEVMTTIGKGGIPKGYIAQNVNAQYFPPCHQIGLDFNFYDGQFYSGGDYVLSVGVIENKSQDIIEFKENYCAGVGVVAVAASPYTELLPSQKTEVFVMYQREIAANQTNHSSRPSLLKK